MTKKNITIKKTYQNPSLTKLGNMIKVTLPGGSLTTEGQSGKGKN